MNESADNSNSNNYNNQRQTAHKKMRQNNNNNKMNNKHTKDTDTVRPTICVVLTSIVSLLSPCYSTSSHCSYYPCCSHAATLPPPLPSTLSLSWQLIKNTNKRTSTKQGSKPSDSVIKFGQNEAEIVGKLLKLFLL